MRIALHLAQRGADDHLEAEEGRRRVAGKAEYGRAVDDAERLRFARAHVHRGHEQIAGVINNLLDEVVIAVGGAATGDDEIVIGRGSRDGCTQPVEIVGRDGQNRGNGTRVDGARRQCVAVGIADLALRGHFSWLDQL